MMIIMNYKCWKKKKEISEVHKLKIQREFKSKLNLFIDINRIFFANSNEKINF